MIIVCAFVVWLGFVFVFLYPVTVTGSGVWGELV